jgi:hypothetical protein
MTGGEYITWRWHEVVMLNDVDRTGMIGTRHGIFPSNYVKMKE